MSGKMMTITKGQMRVAFLPTGDIYEICNQQFMINQLNGNEIDGSINQIYLRVFTKEGIKSTPLLGLKSNSSFFKTETGLLWQGQFEAVTYTVRFKLSEENHWFWEVSLQGDQEIDLLYGQDVGLAAKEIVQANEAYTSQYVDHHVTKDQGYTIASRQNQLQGGKFPYLQQGCLSETVGYSVDGYQFFGRSYKETNQPEALQMTTLPSEVYQYEMAYVALQTVKVNVKQPQQFVFYGSFLENHAAAVEEPYFSKETLQSSWELLKSETAGQVTEIEKIKRLSEGVVQTFSLSDQEITSLFGKQIESEQEAGQLLSFFTEDMHHVVLKEKEVQMERAHGHILLSGNDLTVEKPLMSTTVYMYGIFNSQIVLGNTTMNKFLSNSRNSLNLMKKSGQRIYLKKSGEWQLLAMPSAFEMGFNCAKWYYKLADDLLTVTTFTSVEGRQIQLTIESQEGKYYDFLISNQVLMNDSEESQPFRMERLNDILTFTSTENSSIGQEYPELTYHLHLDKPFAVLNQESLLGENAASEFPLVFVEVVHQSTLQLTIQGNFTGLAYEPTELNEAQEVKKYGEFIHQLIQGFKLENENPEVASEVQRMTLLAHWYTHNMLVHYLSPHGLEQYGGAAWGTRDVSQGPVEYFLATNQPAIVREIIKKIYANQFEDDGNWSQWFMFDRFEKVKAEESHGDVIVWPIKVVGDYILQTGDYSILSERIPYTKREDFCKTTAKYSLYEHIQKQIATIENNFLAGTYLSCYGDGDWDDTLQPYNQKLKKQMASSWTVALTYQTLRNLMEVFQSFDGEYAAHLAELVTGIKKDFNKYMLGTSVIPGFVYMEANQQVELMIHPEDKKTGIQYRLLPMTRSMIAELISPEVAAHHYQLIKQNLKFPDGVRLMNRPANYQGGVSINFKRAEQAANFGREIGLQYVHAHIRYTEAMAKIGEKEETWQALNTINPISITKQVKNAELRQSNVYFSSSDGDFKTRYEAQANFGKLREGSVGVKGGWRIYSSGPGIYINQLISNVLGIRQTSTQTIIDPVLPEKMNGTKFTYTLLGKPVTIRYCLGNENRQVELNGTPIAYTVEKNRYRVGGLVLENNVLMEQLQKANELVIYC